MSFGPTNYRRGGTRGGADQFKWEDVKNDKYRENYLGHSVQAPVGRWQKGKDLTWYAKLSKDDRAAALQEEIALAKQRDQELMDQALGIAPKKRPTPTGQLDANEMKELLKRGASDREGLDGERIEGLGAAPVPHEFATKPKKTLAQKYEDDLANGRTEEDIYALRGSAGVAGLFTEPRSENEESALKKAMKKQKKKEKKAKKEKKREKKRERRASRDDKDALDADRSRLERRGRSRERRDRPSPRGRSASSSWSSHSPSRSRSPLPPRQGSRRSRSRSTSYERHRSGRSRSRPRRHRRSHSRSPEDRRYRDRRYPPRSRGRSDSRDHSPHRRY